MANVAEKDERAAEGEKPPRVPPPLIAGPRIWPFILSLWKRPGFFAFLYFTQIFVFAYIYSHMESQFYAPYAKDESWSGDDKSAIINKLNGRLGLSVGEAIK